MMSLFYEKFVLEAEKIKIVSQTSVEQQLYEKYKSDMKNWQDEKKRLIGDEKTDNSIKYFENELHFIQNSLKGELEHLDNERIHCMQGLYENLQKICRYC